MLRSEWPPPYNGKTTLSDELTPSDRSCPLARSLGRASGWPSSRCLYVQHVIPLQPHQHAPHRSLATTTVGRARFSSNKVNRGPSFSDRPHEIKTPQTLTEKIVQRHAVGLPKGKLVRSGDYVQIRPHRCLSHDNTWPIAQKFMSGPPEPVDFAHFSRVGMHD